MRLEYINPLAGLVMLIVGIALFSIGSVLYGIVPIVVGIFLVLYYRRFLFEIMGLS